MRCGRSVSDPPHDPVAVDAAGEVAELLVEFVDGPESMRRSKAGVGMWDALGGRRLEDQGDATETFILCLQIFDTRPALLCEAPNVLGKLLPRLELPATRFTYQLHAGEQVRCAGRQRATAVAATANKAVPRVGEWKHICQSVTRLELANVACAAQRTAPEVWSVGKGWARPWGCRDATQTRIEFKIETVERDCAVRSSIGFE